MPANPGDARAVPGGDAAGPLPQRCRAGIVEAEHRDRGLEEEPAHPARARLGDPPPELRLSRAQRARDQPQIGLDLVRPAEAGGVVQRGHEGRRRHRPDMGDALQPAHPLVCLRDRGDPLSRVASCCWRWRMTASNGATSERSRPGGPPTS